MSEPASAVELHVREARPRDAGRGIVRLPADARQRLGVLSGDAVVIEGTGRTIAKVWPAGPELGARALRMDGETRRNAGVSVGDAVRVSRGDVTPASRIVVAAADGGFDGGDGSGADAEEVADAVQRALLDRPVAEDEQIRVEALGSAREFQVVDTEPAGAVLVTEQTTVEVSTTSPVTSVRPVGITYEDVGGLDDELESVRELVELPLSEPELFRRLGIDPPRGVLLHGPPGTGKTLIARAVAAEADAHFISISGPELVRKYKGESEELLRETFESARERAPSIVFFDEIDSVASRRDEDADMESRIVAQLLSLLDGLEARGEVVVIGATNRIDAIDPALRRPGRFDREIEVGVPDRDGRREILDVHTRGMPLADDVDLDRIADRTYGFVGADLQALATEAAMAALRRIRAAASDAADAADPADATDPADAADPAEGASITRSDFDRALASVEPSAMREYVAERPEVGFDDVGGLDEAKATLRETIAWPLAYPNLFTATATDPPSGILLYGPPGTGKTLLAEAIAHESGTNVIRVAGPELLDRYVGESERAVRRLFERARQAAPAIVFFDEIDAIGSRRGGDANEAAERVVSQLLTELDAAAANPNLVVLAATNRRDALDPALLRPGRLETHVEVPPPDEAGRRQILAIHARDKPLAADVDLDGLAAELSGYTGADLDALVRQASMRAIRAAADERGVEAADEAAGEIRIDRSHFATALDALDRDDGPDGRHT